MEYDWTLMIDDKRAKQSVFGKSRNNGTRKTCCKRSIYRYGT